MVFGTYTLDGNREKYKCYKSSLYLKLEILSYIFGFWYERVGSLPGYIF